MQMLQKFFMRGKVWKLCLRYARGIIMKKKKLVYGFGLALCIAGLLGVSVNTLPAARKETITEEKKLPDRLAEETLEAGALSEEVSLTEMIDDTESTEKTTEYLEYYFGASIKEDGFFGVLEKICPPVNENQTGEEQNAGENRETDESPGAEEKAEDMVKAAVIAAGKQELALTYSEEKIKGRMEFYGVVEAKNKSEDTAYNYVVCALDLGMINAETAQHAIDGEISEKEQGNLLMAVASLTGKGRNYLGYSNDSDIFAKLRFLYEVYRPFSQKEMESAISLLFEEELTGECVLRSRVYDAGFLPSLTVYYSHDSLEHMEQLLGLLNSENIVVKVQLEPKMILDASAAKQLEQLKAEETSGICVGQLAYDLVLEFENQEDMARFETLVDEYAQIKEENEEENTEGKDSTAENQQSVIAGAGSEHIYVTTVNERLLEETKSKEIEKITIENEEAGLELYCLSEQADSVKEQILEAAKQAGLSIYEVQEKERMTEEKSGLKLYVADCLCNQELFTKLGGVEEQTKLQ